ncbi:MAG: hypothetical protein LBV41_02985 [Cytophagaceae bacterium]|jgi:hypothetical protein|nr:hypothetical protein [Cytophagaceae bacterium]
MTEKVKQLGNGKVSNVRFTDLAGLTSLTEIENNGLTKREYFAAMAMQGMLSDPEREVVTISDIACDCARYADALLEELSKTE